MTDWNALLANDWPALLPAIAALPPAQQKQLGTWAKAQWKTEFEREFNSESVSQPSQATLQRWMRLLVAHTATGPKGKPAIPIPRRSWQSSWAWLAEWPIPLEARATLAQAVANRGAEFAQAWVDRHTMGRRALPMYPEVTLAVIEAAGLNLPADPQLVQQWQAQLRIWPRAHSGNAPKPAHNWPAIATLAVQGTQVVALHHAKASSPALAAAQIHGFARMWHEGLRQPNTAGFLLPSEVAEPEATRAIVQALFEQGTLDRQAVWRDTLQALTRGDNPATQRTLAKLAAWCAPGAAQIAADQPTLINLLAGNVGQVAELAQTLLRQLEQAAPLADAAFVQASQMVFARKEKGLKRQQLAWAEQRAHSALPADALTATKAKRGKAGAKAKADAASPPPAPANPAARMSSALLALGEALADPDYALQQQAAQAITGLWPHWLKLAQASADAPAKASADVSDASDVSAALLAQLDANTALLDAGLRTHLHTTWGMQGLPPENRRQDRDTADDAATNWTPAPIQSGLPPAPPFTPLAGPLLDPESHQRAIGLARASANPGTEVIEQLINLAVRLLREQGDAALDQARALFELIGWGEAAEADWRAASLLEVHGLPGQSEHEPPSFKRGFWRSESLLPPMAIMVARMLELRAALFGLPPEPQPQLPDAVRAAGKPSSHTPWPGAIRPLPPLLSRPSRSNGAIDATGLLARMRDAAQAGPGVALCMGPNDLLLALLRCGPADADTLAGLRALQRPEATLAADFLAAGGVAQLQATHWLQRPMQTAVHHRDAWVHSQMPEIVVEAAAIAQRPALSGVPMSWALGHSAGNAQSPYDWDMREHWLSGVLPQQAEALAMWLLWNLRKAGHDSDSINGKGTAMQLPMVLAAGGPAGPALHLAVLYTLSANDAAARLVGSDALLTLIEQGRFDAELARTLTEATVSLRSVKPARLVPGLARVVDAGQAPAVWPMLQAAVQAALALDKAPPGTPDLLALATRLLSELGAPAPHTAMREAVARAAERGSSKLTQQAKRLHAVLGQV